MGDEFAVPSAAASSDAGCMLRPLARSSESSPPHALQHKAAVRATAPHRLGFSCINPLLICNDVFYFTSDIRE
jgi:hypothetical protein